MDFEKENKNTNPPDKVVSYCISRGLDVKTIRWSTTRWLANNSNGEVCIINPLYIE